MVKRERARKGWREKGKEGGVFISRGKVGMGWFGHDVGVWETELQEQVGMKHGLKPTHYTILDLLLQCH